MKKWWFPLISILVVVFILSACSQPSPTPSQAPPQTSSTISATKPTSAAPSAPASITASTSAPGAKILKFAADMPPNGPIVAGWTWFGSELEKKTNGKYKIDFYFSQSLVKSAEKLNAVSAGIADFGNASLSAFSQAFPSCGVFTLPSVHFPDTTAGHAAALAAQQQLLAKYPVMNNEFKNFKLFTISTLPANLIMTRKVKVLVPNDLKGLKMASQGMDKDIVNLAGGAAVQMIPSEAYPAIDKGVVEGGTFSWIHMPANHYEELCQYYLDYTFGHDIQTSIISLNTWNSLPQDVQKIITDLAPEAIARSDASYIANIDIGKKMVLDKNRVISVPTAEQKKLWETLIQPMDSIWLDSMKAKGISDAPAILSDLKKLSVDAWSKNQ